jgi:hypothetical protein
VPADLADLPARRFLALFLIGIVIAAAPMLAADHLPLVDYPNHLARMHIIAAGDGASLRQFYSIVWRPVPNLAMDLVVPWLSLVMPLECAGKLFLLLSFLMTTGGAAAIHRQLFGRWSAWPLLAFLLLYSRSLLWGFGNFIFGVGLLLVAVALWIALCKRAVVWRIVVATPLSLALYFAHFFAFGAYAVVIFGFELGRLGRRRWRGEGAWRDFLVAGVPFLPAVAIFLANARGPGGGIAYSRLVRKLDLLFNVFDNYVLWFDIASFAVLCLAVALAAGRRKVRIAPAMALPLGLLCLAQIAMPNRIIGAAGVDHRMPLILALLFVSASDWLVAERRNRTIIASLLVALLIVRAGIVTATWRAQDHALAPMVAALEQLPQGCRLAVAYPPSAVNVSRRDPPVLHLAAYAASGADCFVPTLFTDPGQQPLGFTARYAALAGAVSPGEFWEVLAEGRPDPEGHVARALAGYDFILFVGEGAAAVPATPRLVPRAEIGLARLFVVSPDASRAE